ncbi:hypothetical protein PHYPSEUDO_010177 [Phytophthora pseudosyringae]|uniref:PLD phosphodiesterase domain-containing protein n=1 Tax=Phytophthora pseudosyringae TaxID=221518 RepID=A0A8T1W6D7_9STRA|nr:hypothetical protein PHYPSEUDO_010177 [Phytophthora pseudosyringae]
MTTKAPWVSKTMPLASCATAKAGDGRCRLPSADGIDGQGVHSVVDGRPIHGASPTLPHTPAFVPEGESAVVAAVARGTPEHDSVPAQIREPSERFKPRLDETGQAHICELISSADPGERVYVLMHMLRSKAFARAFRTAMDNGADVKIILCEKTIEHCAAALVGILKGRTLEDSPVFVIEGVDHRKIIVIGDKVIFGSKDLSEAAVNGNEEESWLVGGLIADYYAATCLRKIYGPANERGSGTDSPAVAAEEATARPFWDRFIIQMEANNNFEVVKQATLAQDCVLHPELENA